MYAYAVRAGSFYNLFGLKQLDLLDLDVNVTLALPRHLSRQRTDMRLSPLQECLY